MSLVHENKFAITRFVLNNKLLVETETLWLNLHVLIIRQNSLLQSSIYQEFTIKKGIDMYFIVRVFTCVPLGFFKNWFLYLFQRKGLQKIQS